MSLLMDALKKAERARAARQEGDVDEVREETPLSLDPIDAPGEPQEASQQATEEAPASVPGKETLSTGLGDESAAFELERDDSLELDLSNDQLQSASDSASMRRPPGPEDTGARNVEEVDDATSATLPSLKAARESVNRYFDDTGASSVSLSMEQILPTDDDATITGQRHEVEREVSQQSARAVFAAKAVRRKSTGARWALFLGVPCVLTLAAAGGYAFWKAETGSAWSGVASRTTPARITPGSSPAAAQGRVARSQPAPRATPTARSGQPIARAPETKTAPSSPSQTASTVTALASTSSAVPSAKGAESTTGVVASSSTVAAPSAPTKANARQAKAPSRGDLTPVRSAPKPAAVAPDPPAIPSGPPVLTDAQFEEMLREASPLPKGFDTGAGIRIKRGRSTDPARSMLTNAYRNYTDGDLSAARAEYETVLARRPGDRDALLGLAAVAIRTGNLQAAQAHYASVLTRNPRDPIARAALVDILTDLDPVAGETQLKALLADDPGAGYLNFSLGNVYARQARWPEAQAAYFQAYRADAQNPDYAFNLAVSLDQLGQPNAARQYYQNALTLSDARTAGFAPDDAMARIRAIAE